MKIIICDDQAIIRDGLELLLRLDREIEVVGKAGDGAAALELVERHRPDLVLMDLKMPGMNGVEATRRLRDRFHGTKVLILTTFDDDEWLFDVLRAGADGYLLKDTPRADVIKAVKGTVAGKTFMDPTVAGRVLQQAMGSPAAPSSFITERISDREVEVLRLLAAGLSNRDIAQQLHLSEGTVRNYVSAIIAQLGVSDRTQAAILAVRHGLVA
ncbi:MAG: response regulator transcription factor [Caldilinea sp.]|nr:response regulator transcription factor [Caldilinea sp.]MCB0150220.1 response regulator transcription factor [Caldilineaceae bacterium]MCB0039379.1 response regulator transcription factor [Caldilinea sp.]MCB0049064.1 response regulator transcription factor [Caldilinea sp.]MCB9118042.1 response regulator transcription factor [Caldilineaceae bacterium]